ncbi:hypothetical protein H5410_032168 [Solanum commersonii]|uniref:Uncharacterized protein n=1 Tax=Solanum commersonii TaxID=4109 RepID=A0A9J5YPJ6_SOLCO|nr:hypothetical protein H5410_032168 [Solanum commersonii]
MDENTSTTAPLPITTESVVSTIPPLPINNNFIIPPLTTSQAYPNLVFPSHQPTVTTTYSIPPLTPQPPNTSTIITPSFSLSPSSNLTQESQLLSINASAQAPIKLTPSNYQVWYTQWRSLLIGYGFTSYVVNSPMRQQLTSEFWNRQDQLIRSALVASLSSEVVPLVLSVDTSFDVWTTLHNTYARPSRARLLGLKESLSQATKGTQSMSSYLQHIKQLVTTLNSAGATLTMDDITLHVIHGLSPEYRGICDSLRTRDSPITFDELHEKLCDYEAYLCRRSAASSMPITANFVAKSNSNNSRNNKNNRQSTFQNQNASGHRNNQEMNSRQSNKQSSRVICQYRDKPGHVVKQCRKLQASFPWLR